MNYKVIAYVLGKLMAIEAVLLVLAFGVSIYYGESGIYVSFIVPIVILLILYHAFGIRKPKDMDFYAKEGFLITALGWIIMSLIGALPFYISGYIPYFSDAFFETVSGFTTTGATIIPDVEIFPRGLLFWRSSTHWIGGMGVLLFLLALLPKIGKRSLYIMRAEVPGPEVGKVNTKASSSARIMYYLYIGLTVLEIVLLLAGGMPLFDAVTNAFSTAGTGGFSRYNASIGAYNNRYYEVVIAVFMMLFGVNFNIYLLLVTRKFKQALLSEELRVYLLIVICSVGMIALNIYQMFDSIGETLLNSFFHVTSVMSTTGFCTTDVNLWPTFAKTILILLMFVGGCAGSTAGGLKVARIMILFKNARRELHQLVHPHSIKTVRFESRPLDEKTAKATNVYMVVFLFIFAGSILLFSLEGYDMETTFAVVSTCINNIGLMIGSLSELSAVSPAGKWLLSFDMLIGRLEIFPILILCIPSLWASKNKR